MRRRSPAPLAPRLAHYGRIRRAGVAQRRPGETKGQRARLHALSCRRSSCAAPLCAATLAMGGAGAGRRRRAGVCHRGIGTAHTALIQRPPGDELLLRRHRPFAPGRAAGGASRCFAGASQRAGLPGVRPAPGTQGPGAECGGRHGRRSWAGDRLDRQDAGRGRDQRPGDGQASAEGAGCSPAQQAGQHPAHRQRYSAGPSGPFRHAPARAPGPHHQAYLHALGAARPACRDPGVWAQQDQCRLLLWWSGTGGEDRQGSDRTAHQPLHADVLRRFLAHRQRSRRRVHDDRPLLLQPGGQRLQVDRHPARLPASRRQVRTQLRSLPARHLRRLRAHGAPADVPQGAATAVDALA